MKAPMLLALALAVGASVAAPAYADSPTAVGVRFNDLNLKSTDRCRENARAS